MKAMGTEIGPIHFVGIGGIGMSGIAEVMHHLGYRVQGSDQAEGYVVEGLRKRGIKVEIGHAADNLGDARVVVCSTAISRGNPEIERRAQEVINHCWQQGEANPILAIHDVGAGGLSNAFPELTNDAGRGARFDLGAVPLEESGMAPKEIWCNES